jgi:hypothetical protein
MKLELKHLAPYLPYGLKNKRAFYKPRVIDGIVGNKIYFGDTVLFINQIEPILRPLSDLNKVIEHNKEDFIPCIEYNYIREYLEELSTLDHTYIKHVKYKVIIVLLELHFDIFGLIEKGLAIDINKLK